MRARPGSEAGFTMIEVLIAILLCSITVIAIVALFIGQGKAATRSRRENEAAALANDKLEWLRTQATPVSGSDAAPIDVQGYTSTYSTYAIYSRKWIVSTSGGINTLTVKVGWDEDGVPSQTCSVDSACSSKYCNGSTCMSYAVTVYGKRL